MEKKVIQITKDDLKNMVIETTQTILNSPSTVFFTPRKMITEMARINKKESGKGIFPYNSFVVRIWSNDHEPSHFHVEKDGWDIAFMIADGELYKVERSGKDEQIYSYVLSNVKEWLKSKSAIIPSITNQQNALSIWEQLHD